MYADVESDRLLQMAPEERYKSILKMNPQERLDLARLYRGPKAMQLVEGMKPEQQETITAKPGAYVQVCFMSTQDGRSHSMLGMERVLKITK